MRSSTPSSNNAEITVAPSRSGPAYASFGSLHLNSPYDPVREARRFVEEKSRPGSPEACLILGDTLPYLQRALRERHPNAAILSVYYDEALVTAAQGEPSWCSNCLRWSPENGRKLADFLREVLSAVNIERLLVLEWAPSAAAFPAQAARAAEAVRQILREAAGERATEAVFARSWLHNLFANYLAVDAWYALPRHGVPLVIAASGPSLARAIPLLAHLRSHFFLIALPSSMVALRSAGLNPDLVVSVDGGYWAQTHLRSLSSEVATPVAFPLIAARGIWRRPCRPILVSAGSFIEEEIASEAGLRPQAVVATGTVAASAYELAPFVTNGPVIFAGLDLASDGLAEHVRPHGFDAHFELLARRTVPLPTVLAHRNPGSVAPRHPRPRSLGTGDGAAAALETYAGWFAGVHAARPTYRLFPSRVVLPAFRPLDSRGLEQLLAGSPPTEESPPLEVVASSTLAERVSVVRRLLGGWRERLREVQRRLDLVDPHGAAGEARSMLLRSLAPREYSLFRRADPGSADRQTAAEALVETASLTLSRLEKRYLP